MTDRTNEIVVRPVRPSDVPILCTLLNAIIRIGGTTAHETPFTPERFSAYFIDAPNCISCFVALDFNNVPCAFQGLEQNDGLPADWVDIGTFARPEDKVPGAGTALFAATRAQAHSMGFVAINATIRADNTGGLAYYGKMGFENYKVDRAIPLKDGRPVDRISKRYLL